jgi:hypothetical protein
MAGRYRYIVQHPISGEDLEPLVSGLEDEQDFRLAELIGQDALKGMLATGEVEIDVTVPQRFFAFGSCLAILSVYLPEYVSGVEVVEELDLGHRRSKVECWRYVGRQGDLLTVPLQYALSLDREIIAGREDVAQLRLLWRELPDWARVAYKLTFDELADLDAGG